MLNRQKVTDIKLSTITNEMRELLDKAIVGSRKVEVEAREETVRDVILRYIQIHYKKYGEGIRAQRVVGRFEDQFPTLIIVEELARMKSDGIITFDGDDISPETMISIRKTKN
jgi:hypothetical protein